MSRIGKKPVSIPTGVEVSVSDSNLVTVKGPKGTLTNQISPEMDINIENNEVVVNRPSDNKKHRALHGLSRSLVSNMIEGVTNGYSKKLELVGVGYRASKKGKNLVLNVGYSHPVEIEQPETLEIEVPENTKITVSGIDKQLVGQMAARIRAVREPEPYLAKGIRYEGEYIRRKEGKTGK
ncbi:50S ribosomal protein L6 [Proteinivorax hydrogeniformans]|uniref:Large ribosomal subunit protein uL6 n=1 Tax=Proteinivorax hydrogeniformans TaxID=1826727 RepID=A0AAU8HU31_9FIRM